MRMHLWTITLLLAAGPCAASTPWSFGAEGGVSYDDNVGNAGSSGDKQAAERVAAGAYGQYTLPFGLYSALQLRGTLDGEGVANVSGLSFGRVSARARFLAKPGEGFFVPVIAATVGGGYKVSGSSLRSGDELRVGAYVAEPVTTQVNVRLGWDWTRKDSASRVFDGQNRGVELSLDWAVLPALTLYGEARRETGPIVVSANGGGVITPKTEHLVLNAAADAVEADDAFGDDWWAFRVTAATHLFTLGANLPLTKDLSLDAQLRHAHATVDYDYSAYGGGGGGGGGTVYPSPAYDRWIGGVSLLMRF